MNYSISANEASAIFKKASEWCVQNGNSKNVSNIVREFKDTVTSIVLNNGKVIAGIGDVIDFTI